MSQTMTDESDLDCAFFAGRSRTFQTGLRAAQTWRGKLNNDSRADQPGPIDPNSRWRNVLGDLPVSLLNVRLNCDTERNPTSKAMAPTRRLGFCRRLFACSTR